MFKKHLTLEIFRIKSVSCTALLGGSSRLRTVHDVLKDRFPGKSIVSREMDTIASIGAASSALQIARSYLPKYRKAGTHETYTKSLCDSIAFLIGISASLLLDNGITEF